jgi:hypothetical protein
MRQSNDQSEIYQGFREEAVRQVIERGKIHDNFELRKPGGTVITFNSGSS